MATIRIVLGRGAGGGRQPPATQPRKLRTLGFPLQPPASVPMPTGVQHANLNAPLTTGVGGHFSGETEQLTSFFLRVMAFLAEKACTNNRLFASALRRETEPPRSILPQVEPIPAMP